MLAYFHPVLFDTLSCAFTRCLCTSFGVYRSDLAATRRNRLITTTIISESLVFQVVRAKMPASRVAE